MMRSPVLNFLFCSREPTISPTKIPLTTTRLRNVRSMTKMMSEVVHLFALCNSRFARKNPTRRSICSFSNTPCFFGIVLFCNPEQLVTFGKTTSYLDHISITSNTNSHNSFCCFLALSTCFSYLVYVLLACIFF